MAERPTRVCAPDADGRIRITCPQCEALKVLPAERFARLAGPVSLRCQCGAVFPCEFDFSGQSPASSPQPSAPTESAAQKSAASAGKRVSTFTADPDGIVRVACPACGSTKMIRSEKLAPLKQPVNLKCKCGNEFLCRFNLSPTETTLPARVAQSTPAQVQTVFPDDADRMHVTCPGCRATRSIPYEKVKQHTRPVRTKCASCGLSFPVRFLPREQDPSRRTQYPEQTFYADLGGRVTIICPACEKGRTLMSSELANVKQPAPIRCSCGAVFPSRFVLEQKAPEDQFQTSLPASEKARQDEARYAKTMHADELGHFFRKLESGTDDDIPVFPSVTDFDATVELDRREFRAAGLQTGSGVFFPAGEGDEGDEDIPEVDAVEVEDVEPVYDEEAAAEPARPKLEPYTVLDRFEDDWPLLNVNVEKKVQAPCMYCKRVNILDLSDRNDVTAVQVNCECGNKYPVRIEYRKTYRKRVSLDGFYFTDEGAKREMVVRDISLGGVGFHSRDPHQLVPRSVIDILFHLDDSKGTRIYRKVMVRNVRGRFIGVQFIEHRERDKELGFYLMA